MGGKHSRWYENHDWSKYGKDYHRYRYPTRAMGGCMFGRLSVFIVGIAAGIYLDQRYKIPNIREPSEVYKKAKEAAQEYKRDEYKTKPPTDTTDTPKSD